MGDVGGQKMDRELVIYWRTKMYLQSLKRLEREESDVLLYAGIDWHQSVRLRKTFYESSGSRLLNGSMNIYQNHK